jgi:hypothetical protein
MNAHQSSNALSFENFQMGVKHQPEMIVKLSGSYYLINARQYLLELEQQHEV